MSPILLDTDIVIEVLRQRDEAILQRWKELGAGSDPIYYTPVTAAELWHGLREPEETRTRQLLSVLFCVPLTAEIGCRAGDYLRRFHAGHGLELGDALIAATASLNGCALWTRNRRHYPMKDLRFA